MATVAVYSRSGGVGKTTLAINLAWASARLSKYRTLMWDLDPQGAATFSLFDEASTQRTFRATLAFSVAPLELVQKSSVEGLDLLCADESLRDLGRIISLPNRANLIRPVLDQLSRHYDRIILDCPPGLTMLGDHATDAAAVLVVPVSPSTASQRGYLRVAEELSQKAVRPFLMPVLTLVDRKRALHREVLDIHPDWPVVPTAETIEEMDRSRIPICAGAPRSDAARAYARVWHLIEAHLSGGNGNAGAVPPSQFSDPSCAPATVRR